MPTYYALTVSNRAGRAPGGAPEGPYEWSGPFASAPEAKREGRRLLDAGETTLAFVVEEKGSKRRLLPTFTQPASAEKIVRHVLAAMGLCEEGPPVWPVRPG